MIDYNSNKVKHPQKEKKTWYPYAFHAEGEGKNPVRTLNLY